MNSRKVKTKDNPELDKPPTNLKLPEKNSKTKEVIANEKSIDKEVENLSNSSSVKAAPIIVGKPLPFLAELQAKRKSYSKQKNDSPTAKDTADNSTLNSTNTNEKDKIIYDSKSEEIAQPKKCAENDFSAKQDKEGVTYLKEATKIQNIVEKDKTQMINKSIEHKDNSKTSKNLSNTKDISDDATNEDHKVDLHQKDEVKDRQEKQQNVQFSTQTPPTRNCTVHKKSSRNQQTVNIPEPSR